MEFQRQLCWNVKYSEPNMVESDIKPKAPEMDSRRDRSYKYVFKGSVLVNTLIEYDTQRFSNREAAVQFGQRLLELGQIESIVGTNTFDDSVALYRWSDESVVKEAKKLVHATSSQIPRKRLIELLDLHSADGEEMFDLSAMRDKFSGRGNERTELEPEGGAVADYRTLTGDNIESRLERFQRLAESSTSSSPRRRYNHSQDALDGADEHKQQGPRHHHSDSNIRGHQLSVRDEFQDEFRQGQPLSSDFRSDTRRARDTDCRRARDVDDSRVFTAGAGDYSDDEIFNDDEEVLDVIDLVPEQGVVDGHYLVSVDNTDDETREDTLNNTVRYDGVEMPALDLEHIDFDNMEQEQAVETLAALQKSLENLTEERSSFSDNEKQLFDQMKRMQEEHTRSISTYEEKINDLLEKLKLFELSKSTQRAGEHIPLSSHINEGSAQAQPASLLSQPDMGLDSPRDIPPAPALPGPPPPPPPPSALMGMGLPKIIQPTKPAVKPRVKMRPLFWNRIIFNNEEDVPKTTIWNNTTEPNFNVDDFEKYFGQDMNKVSSKKRSLHDAMSPTRKSKGEKVETAKLLDEHRSRAVGIKLRSMHCQMDDIRAALYKMDFSKVDVDSLQDLYMLRGTSEELDKINTHMQQYQEVPLDQPEQFMLEVSKMPYFAERVECLMLRKRLNESVFNIEQQLKLVNDAGEQLQQNEAVKSLIELVLAFGNYMNGGTQRGQADGFNLLILSKLKDVKSMDKSINLLQYIVRTHMREHEPDAGKDEAIFKLPDPSYLQQAAGVDFNEVDTELNRLKHQLQTHCKKADIIHKNIEQGLLQPFKDQMDEFFETADDMLKRQVENFDSAQDHFTRLLQFMAMTDSSEQKTPITFFGIWAGFVEEYKRYWQVEQKKIAKDMFDKVTKKRRERQRKAQRRKSIVEDGKSNLKQKFALMRRNSNVTHTVKILRSQSMNGLENIGKTTPSPEPVETSPARELRRRRILPSEPDKTKTSGSTNDLSSPRRLHSDSGVPTVGPSESMIERLRSRRRTRAQEAGHAEPIKAVPMSPTNGEVPSSKQTSDIQDRILRRRRSRVEGMDDVPTPTSSTQTPSISSTKTPVSNNTHALLGVSKSVPIGRSIDRPVPNSQMSNAKTEPSTYDEGPPKRSVVPKTVTSVNTTKTVSSVSTSIRTRSMEISEARRRLEQRIRDEKETESRAENGISTRRERPHIGATHNATDRNNNESDKAEVRRHRSYGATRRYSSEEFQNSLVDDSRNRLTNSKTLCSSNDSLHLKPITTATGRIRSRVNSMDDKVPPNFSSRHSSRSNSPSSVGGFEERRRRSRYGSDVTLSANHVTDGGSTSDSVKSNIYGENNVTEIPRRRSRFASNNIDR